MSSDDTSRTASLRDAERTASLRDAETKAVHLFDEVVARGLLAPGRTESAVSDDIRDLSVELFGTRKYWHKRIVRAGVNTLEPYKSNPPDRVIGEDDIAFLDFGPIFEEWEADFGRTYVLGDDPAKIALRDALEPVWLEGRRFFESEPDVTGARLYDHVVRVAAERGLEFGAEIAGHLVGEFPHEKIRGDSVTNYITPGSDLPMRRTDGQGRPCHWILEIHLVDRGRGIGAFFEQLLDIP
ncbi:aminopeptidase P family protein [Rhodococcus triatomae]|uniref:M24 family metallopeptidase n=1 Tax=Rhodococcus triatomae TaxID=300028 RepID=UPI0009323344|nr:M24 family metallopeptidase [Rhodococcus triatomae]QNG20865.1 aminopeptidase P family protein [Rhodococcus triatomae]QNG23220.1 aminopeptidase P family protein [Rhodococcus triatomae]